MEEIRKDLTPIEKIGGIYVKREDLFEICGVRGAKARTAYVLATKTNKRLVTAGSRQSPQINILAHIARELKVPLYAFCPEGQLSDELIEANNIGANIIQVKQGYNNVIIKRAKDFAEYNNMNYIPFGMECEEAVNQAKNQCSNIPVGEIKRIVVSVGSGMNLCGILQFLSEKKLNIPVLGVVVGANPEKRLNKWAPKNWREMVTLVKSELDYHYPVKNSKIGEILLDEIYEAKCLKYLNFGDLFWIIGRRNNQ